MYRFSVQALRLQLAWGELGSDLAIRVTDMVTIHTAPAIIHMVTTGRIQTTVTTGRTQTTVTTGRIQTTDTILAEHTTMDTAIIASTVITNTTIATKLT